MSAKSRGNANVKKMGKTVLEKRAQKRAKAESADGIFSKPRKNQR
ncbi:hypothetical protein OHC50_00440 [Paenarthrobacter ilicis]